MSVKLVHDAFIKKSNKSMLNIMRIFDWALLLKKNTTIVFFWKISCPIPTKIELAVLGRNGSRDKI